MNLKPFGHGGTAHEYGYDLPLCLSWLESMVEHESETTGSRGRKHQRLRKVEEAVALLNEAMDMGNEDR